MSYNGYNQNSMYWAGQDRHDQFPSSSGSISGYPTNSYQPQHTYTAPSNQQQSATSSQPATNNVNAHSGQGYGNSAQQSQNTRGDYPNSRADTSRLGNLAYASSLDQMPVTSQAPQRQTSMAYRPQDNAMYGYTNPYSGHTTGPIGNNQQRADSRGSTDTRTQSATQQALPTYQSTNNRAPTQSQPYLANDGKNSPAPQPNSSSYSSETPTQNRFQFPQPPRPSSGQATQRPGSSGSAIRSPSIQNTQKKQKPKAAAKGVKTDSRAQSSKQSNNIRTTPGNIPNARSASSTPAAIPQQNSNSTDRGAQSGAGAAGRDFQRPPDGSANVQTNGQHSKQSSTTEHPTTVDPNQVFNNYEYQQKRQAEAVAAKKREQVANAQPSQSSDVLQAAHAMMSTANSADSGSKKDEMELEMKQMLEKMRVYKAKDPSLFSQIWESVKKTQPAQVPSQSATQSPALPSPVIPNNQSIPSAQLPAESELTPASFFPPDFDRGRYPALRRRRGNKNWTPEKTDIKKSHHKKKPDIPKPASGPAPVPTPASAPIPEGYAPAAIVEEADTQSQTLRQAMQAFHQSSHSPAPPVPLTAQMQSKPPPPKPKQIISSAPTPLPALLSTAPLPPAPIRPFNLPPTGTTFWPENKKRALADTASQSLLNAPQNKGKTISSNDIHALLDTNPSYSEMCEHIEKMGFYIDRGNFARLLLAAVPDMYSAGAPQQPPPQRVFQVPQKFPVTNGSFYAHQGLVHHPPLYHSPFASVSGPSAPVQMTKSDGVPVDPALIKIDQHHRKPTKQEKAVKRSFGEIVDLTQTFSDDDEEYEHYRQKPKTDALVPTSNQENTAQSFDSIRQQALQNFSHGTFRPSVIEGPQKLHRFKANRREGILHDNVIEPMQPRRDALRRSSYKPSTIARDILISSGRHPKMDPLNHHLEDLRRRFSKVNHESDLDTFRWDIVDPGGVPPPTPSDDEDADDEAMGPPITPHKHRVSVVVGAQASSSVRPDFATQPINQEEPTPRKRGRPKLNVSGGGGLTAQGNYRTPQANDDRQSLNNNQTMPQSSPFTPVEKITKPSPSLFPGGSASAMFTNGQGATPSTVATSSTPGSSRTPGRKGRPPGAKNKHVRQDKGIPKKRKSVNLETPISANSTTNPRKPSGLRNAMSPTDRIAVVIPSRSPSVSSARPETKMKNTSDMSFSHKMLKCHWEKCPAELHSLDTLRKHIRKHREAMSSGPPFPCRWAGCFSSQNSLARPSSSSGGEQQRLTFANEMAWQKHMEAKHVDRYMSEAEDDGGTGGESAAIVGEGGGGGRDEMVARTGTGRETALEVGSSSSDTDSEENTPPPIGASA